MRNTLMLLTFLICLISCKSKENKNENKELIINEITEKSFDYMDFFMFKQKDTLTFRDLKYDNELNKYKLNELTHNEITSWTNKFMPEGLVEMTLYSAYFYSFQNETENYRLFSIFTLADDWNKMHLITVSNDNQLIGEFEIGEEISYLIEQEADKEIFGEESSLAIRVSVNIYNVTNETKTTINYFSDKKDSVMIDRRNYIVEINKDGKFLKRNN
jgi:hypothetical protein